TATSSEVPNTGRRFSEPSSWLRHIAAHGVPRNPVETSPNHIGEAADFDTLRIRRAGGCAVIAALTDVVARYPRWGFWKLYDRLRAEGQPLSNKRFYRRAKESQRASFCLGEHRLVVGFGPSSIEGDEAIHITQSNIGLKCHDRYPARPV